MTCYRRLFNISYRDHVPYEKVRREIQAAIAEHDEHQNPANKRNLKINSLVGNIKMI